MNKNEIMTKLSRGCHKLGFELRKRSPELLIIGGLIGVGASAVMACVATTKIDTILEETKDKVDKIHAAEADPALKDRYTKEDVKKDLTITYVQTGVKLAKLYAPAVGLGVLSVTGILASHNILRKRNVALAAAYTAIDNSFKNYRGRVIERFGETVDRELKYNIKAEKVEEIVTDEETGKQKKTKKTIDVVGPDMGSPFARFYDEGCKGWEKDAESNLFFLRAEQNYANDRLRTRGWLLLSEVYERLGIPVTETSMKFGWIYDDKDPDHQGDNYVDFGIYDVNRPKARDFVNGHERVILLDFNVDGPILDKVESHQRWF